MATMGVELTFVDTNILIYANVPILTENVTARFRLDELVALGAPLWISRQILREYLASLTRIQSFTSPITPAALTVDIRRFERQFEIAEDGPAVTMHLLDLLNQIPMGGKQVHDANIVATMIAHGLKRLLTHHVADFRRFSAWIDVIPMIPIP